MHLITSTCSVFCIYAFCSASLRIGLRNENTFPAVLQDNKIVNNVLMELTAVNTVSPQYPSLLGSLKMLWIWNNEYGSIESCVKMTVRSREIIYLSIKLIFWVNKHKNLRLV
jgi:hypothetical protein